MRRSQTGSSALYATFLREKAPSEGDLNSHRLEAGGICCD
jgi:hypothetical protein